MPCVTYTPEEERQMERQSEAESRKILLDETDRVTRLLCRVCRKLDSNGILFPLFNEDTELLKWWEEHLERDKQREIEEQEKRERAKAQNLLDVEIAFKQRELKALQQQREELQ